MELEVLHRSTCPEIVDFYGAFFIESCVYYCMEYMDAGSLDRLEGAGVPEDVSARIAGAMVRGLKFLKDNLQVIHRGASRPVFLFQSLSAYLTLVHHHHRHHHRHHKNNRRETYKRSCKPTRSYQALRFWCIRSAEQEHRTNSHWVPIVYGCM